MTARLLPTLTEHTSRAVELTGAQAAAIAADRALGVQVSPIGPGAYAVRPGSVIGTWAAGDLQLLIRPSKLTMARVVWMLAYALDPVRMANTDFDYERADRIEDIAARALATQLDRALLGGVLQGYRTQHEALATVRGRIRFEDQLRKRFLRFPPAEVSFDEFTEDIDENRMLRAAVRTMLRTPLRSARVRAALRRHYAALSGAADYDYPRSQVPSPVITRLNARFAGALGLARLILTATTYDLGAGNASANTFLVDMNAVFEQFVHAGLEHALGRALVRQHPGELAVSTRIDTRVVRGGLRRAYDTALVTSGGSVKVIVDAKYKRHSANAAGRDDVHQMLAYCIAEGIRDGILVSVAAGGPQLVHTIKNADVRIHVRTIDLSRDQATALAGIGAVADLMDAIAPAARELSPLPDAHTRSPTLVSG